MNDIKDLINRRFNECVNFVLSKKIAENKAKIAEKLGISRSKFSEILNYRMNVSAEMISVFCATYKINSDWILTGDGEIHRKVEVENTVAGESSTLLSIIERKDERIESLVKNVTTLEEQVKQLKTYIKQLRESHASDAMFSDKPNPVPELSKEVQGLSDDTNTQGLIAATNNKQQTTNNKQHTRPQQQ